MTIHAVEKTGRWYPLHLRSGVYKGTDPSPSGQKSFIPSIKLSNLKALTNQLTNHSPTTPSKMHPPNPPNPLRPPPRHHHLRRHPNPSLRRRLPLWHPSLQHLQLQRHRHHPRRLQLRPRLRRHRDGEFQPAEC